MKMFCKDGTPVEVTVVERGRLTVKYKGKYYERPLSVIGEKLFFNKAITANNKGSLSTNEKRRGAFSKTVNKPNGAKQIVRSKRQTKAVYSASNTVPIDGRKFKIQYNDTKDIEWIEACKTTTKVVYDRMGGAYYGSRTRILNESNAGKFVEGVRLISTDSPLGKVLVGKDTGDKFSYDSPAGRVDGIVLEIDD